MVDCKICEHPYCEHAGTQRGIVLDCANYMPRQKRQTNAVGTMTDREKLVELLEKHEYQKHYPSTLAAILLANGVVVREKGKWIEGKKETLFRKQGNYICSNCKSHTGIVKFNFCPNCGADMRKEKPEA